MDTCVRFESRPLYELVLKVPISPGESFRVCPSDLLPARLHIGRWFVKPLWLCDESAGVSGGTAFYPASAKDTSKLHQDGSDSVICLVSSQISHSAKKGGTSELAAYDRNVLKTTPLIHFPNAPSQPIEPCLQETLYFFLRTQSHGSLKTETGGRFDASRATLTLHLTQYPEI